LTGTAGNPRFKGLGRKEGRIDGTLEDWNGGVFEWNDGIEYRGML
jgi:hypothetical protein